jgi:carboxymethylenebutenolidase
MSIVTFGAGEAAASGHLAEAAPEPRRGGIVVIQEWWGLNDQIKRQADRFAAAGYDALAPDLYHGTLARSPDEAQKLLMALDIARAEKDMRGAIEHLRGRTGKAPAVVGFCMGGALSLYAACAGGDGVAACIVYYGGHPKVRYDFDRLRAPVLGHWAEKDDFANAIRDSVGPELKRRGKAFEFHTYPSTRHAFTNENRPEVFDAGATEEAWRRTLAFLAAHL